MTTHEINIDANRTCKRCGKGWATPSGLCLDCVAKMIKNGEFDHIIKPHPVHPQHPKEKEGEK
jgi:hypothetical protein